MSLLEALLKASPKIFSLLGLYSTTFCSLLMLEKARHKCKESKDGGEALA